MQKKSLHSIAWQNCYRHAGFQKEASETPESTVPEKDIEDDIPLAQLVPVMGSQASMDAYMDIDKELPATEDVTDESIFNDLIEARSADAIQSSDEEAEEEPRQKNSIRTSVEFISYVLQTLEETEESTKAQQHLDYVEKFLRKKLFFSNALVQSDLMSFKKK